MIYSEDTKLFRTICYLIWSFFSQLILSIWLCKSMATTPNVVKIFVMITWFIYIIMLYKKLAATFIKLEVVNILQMGKSGLTSLRLFRDLLCEECRGRSGKNGLRIHSEDARPRKDPAQGIFLHHPQRS